MLIYHNVHKTIYITEIDIIGLESNDIVCTQLTSYVNQQLDAS